MKIEKLIALTIMAATSSAGAADIQLVLPVYTKHIVYIDDDTGRNEENYGIGLNFELEHFSNGIVYLDKNSRGNHSVYVYSSFTYKYNADSSLSIGGFAATGYEAPIAIAPFIAYKYKWVRVATTLPFGQMFNAKSDTVNVQLLIPLGE